MAVKSWSGLAVPAAGRAANLLFDPERCTLVYMRSDWMINKKTGDYSLEERDKNLIITLKSSCSRRRRTRPLPGSVTPLSGGSCFLFLGRSFIN